LKKELGPQFSTFKDDGTFWMAFKDLAQYFMSVNICQVSLCLKLSSSSDTGEKARGSSETMARDEKEILFCLRRGQQRSHHLHVPVSQTPSVLQPSHLMAISPSLSLCLCSFRGSVTEPTKAVVTLHQDDRRVLGAQPYLDIGLTVLRETGTVQEELRLTLLSSLSGSQPKWEVVRATGCTVERQVNCEVTLQPGENYLFVPCTTGGKFLQQSR
jgi:hypothetical protein